MPAALGRGCGVDGVDYDGDDENWGARVNASLSADWAWSSERFLRFCC